jgi:hypothetical protein
MPAAAHDVNGILQEQALPKKVREEIDARQQIRLRQRHGATAPAAPPLANPALRSKYESLEGILQALALWEQRSTLSACFMNGSEQAQDAVMTVFQEIIDLTNLKIRKTPCKRDAIRISFRHSGFYSQVGKDLLLVDVGSPTMALENLDLAVPLSPVNKGKVMHEFMHALGALHEHQHPDSGCEQEIRWDVIKTKWGWSDQEMETNFRAKVRSELIRTTAYDVDSLMHYQLEADLLKHGMKSPCHTSYYRTALSDGDRKLLAGTYPRGK